MAIGIHCTHVLLCGGFDGGDLNPLPEEWLHGRLGLDYWLHGGWKNNHVKSFIKQNLLSISSLSIWLGS